MFRKQAAECLLAHGADPNSPETLMGMTPLHIAAKKGLLSIAKLLLSRGLCDYRVETCRILVDGTLIQAVMCTNVTIWATTPAIGRKNLNTLRLPGCGGCQTPMYRWLRKSRWPSRTGTHTPWQPTQKLSQSRSSSKALVERRAPRREKRKARRSSLDELAFYAVARCAVTNSRWRRVFSLGLLVIRLVIMVLQSSSLRHYYLQCLIMENTFSVPTWPQQGVVRAQLLDLTLLPASAAWLVPSLQQLIQL
jgi:Ankyrin repeats (many copies)